MEITTLKNSITRNQHQTQKIALPLSLDLPISKKALMENEIVMYFEKIKSDADAVLYCFQQMDWRMLNNVLDENIKYEELSKVKYIAKLAQHFYYFKLAGDTYLHCFKGKCNGRYCSNKKNTLGFEFIGNKSKKKYNLIVDFANGKVLDLFECISVFNKILK